MKENEEVIDLKCENCGVNYTKPSVFRLHLLSTNSVFYKWSLRYCDKCRRNKEVNALKSFT